MNSAYLSSRAPLAVNKKENYFSLPDHHLPENLIFFFGLYEGQEKDESELVTRLVGIIVAIIFI